MKKGPDVDVPPESPSISQQKSSINPFGDIAETWKGAMAPWLAWFDAAESATGARATKVGEAAAQALMRPDKMLENMSSLSGGLRELVGLPQLADLPDLRDTGVPTFEPALELIAIAQQYMRVGIPIWVEACKRFEKEVAQQNEMGQSADSAGDALELWNTVLDRTLMEFNRSSEFADLQQRYLRAGIRQRLETRRYFEMLAKMADSPTRAEMDDVYRRLHELRRDVAALRASGLRPDSERKTAKQTVTAAKGRVKRRSDRP
jgi:Poly(R)-hydroxyalkanoic acid synthase subunit (PHA_synth_III_E)